MGKVDLRRIWLASTQGPVEIISITEEDPAVHSVVCLQGTFKALPISSDYDAFVRRPTGIIEALTGHRAYRIDVSAPIDQGKSWQLGIALGHILRTADQDKKELLFTSGQVAPDHTISPVSFMADKWQKALPGLIKAQQDGYIIRLFLHPQNMAEIKAAIPSSFQAIEVSSLFEASAAMAVKLKKPSLARGARETTALRMRLGMGTFFLLCLLAVCAWFMPIDIWQQWNAFEQQGRYREMLTSLREQRSDGNWLTTNAAYFFEQHMKDKSRQLSERFHIKVQQSFQASTPCVGAQLNGHLTNQFPTWLTQPCLYEIDFTAIPAQHHLFFAAVIVQDDGQSIELVRVSGASENVSQTPLHFQGRPLGPRETFYLIGLLSERPAFELYSWFDRLITHTDMSKEMNKRLERSGVGYFVATIISDAFNANTPAMEE